MPRAGHTLAPGGTLTAGQALVSSDGHYQLVMQSDGNLVLYSASNQALWSSNTSGAGCAHLALQTDGNLVLYGSKGAVWGSNNVNFVLQPGDTLTRASSSSPSTGATG